MRSFLGLDIGGSKARHAWWPDGAAAGGDGPSVHPAVHGERTGEALAAVLRDAAGTRTPAGCVVAMAGVSAGQRAALTGELMRRGVAWPVTVVGDVLAAAAAGLRDGPGLLLWSGTGSFAVARGADGSLARVGGRGYAFGDEGSGYDLVRRAIVAVLRACDGRGRETVLAESLTEAFGAQSPERLGAVAQRLTPGEVARRLPVVLDAFERDDWVAADVLEGGLRQLVDLGEAALRRVGAEPAAGLSLALGGGVLTNLEVVRDGLVRLAQAAFGCEVAARTLAADDAARGAAWLAAGHHDGASPAKEWVDRVAL